MEYRRLCSSHDKQLAELIRTILRSHHLDMPGTAYYDSSLDHLSDYYSLPGRAYYVLTDHETVIGGIGIAEYDGECCELQKLYLAESARGNGIGYEMIRFIENKAREMGYRQIYLETHTNLQAAIHIYERSGYRQVTRPENAIHSAMNRFYQKDL